MSQDERKEHTTRRRAISSATAAILAGIATSALAGGKSVPGTDIDANLIAACEEFHRLNATMHPDITEADLDVAMDARWAATDEIYPLQPQTAAGVQAKAAVAIYLLQENSADEITWDGCILNFVYRALCDAAGCQV
jgi:predicted nicotinamide N-methyase